MAIEPMEHRGSKLGSMGFFNISIKFLIERVSLCRIFEFWDFGRIASRPQVMVLTTADEQTYVENFSSLGAIAAEK
jgi:hypothetical protein